MLASAIPTATPGATPGWQAIPLALLVMMLCGLFAAIGAAGMFWYWNLRHPQPPDTPALVAQMREVARLETLDVTMYKKVPFQPEPKPADTLMEDLWNFAKSELFPKTGRAIVFADVHLGLDFSKLNTDSLRVHGDSVDVALPPIQATVELKPGETEIIESNLDSEQTAQLLQKAKEAFEREVMSDPKLQERARQSAQRAIKGLLLSVGFREVRFVDSVPRIEPG